MDWKSKLAAVLISTAVVVGGLFAGIVVLGTTLLISVMVYLVSSFENYFQPKKEVP